MEYSEIHEQAETSGLGKLSDLEADYIYSEISYTESIQRRNTDPETMKRHIDVCERFEVEVQPAERRKAIVKFAMRIIEGIIINYYGKEKS